MNLDSTVREELVFTSIRLAVFCQLGFSIFTSSGSHRLIIPYASLPYFLDVQVCYNDNFLDNIKYCIYAVEFDLFRNLT